MKRHTYSRSRVVMILYGLLLPLVFCSSALAQSGTSTVRGTATDPQGNVVVGATVTLTSLGTNTSRTQTTSDSGSYAFDFVQPGLSP